ncbi:response regulator [Olivibacter jilunii]|uniref:Response regulatory domain-containing protein n=1 Tax=Olivibacter jilunii TaxID=985016 RepID=A0ABW6BBM5_9SPHI
MATPHILIADDHSIVRLGISLIIQKQYPKAIIRQTDNYQGVLDMVAKRRLSFNRIRYQNAKWKFSKDLEFYQKETMRNKGIGFFYT